MGLSALAAFAFGRMNAFAVLGDGGAEPWMGLLDSARVRPVRAPRDADLLVLAGEIPRDWGDGLRALFETLALPRLALWLPPPWSCPEPAGVPLGASLSSAGEADWDAIRAFLVSPSNPAGRALLPDRPPHPWRGRGDHGQGGEGMMGGTPYGRPMAMTMEDGDGLALDDVPTALGPWFPGLPSGLRLDLRLQGDRIRACDTVTNRFPRRDLTPSLVARVPALRALAGEPVPVAKLEWARVAAHLAGLSALLGFLGLDDLAAAMRRHRHSRDARAVEPLLARARHRLPRRFLGGIGRIGRERAQALGLTGPVARACGLEADARSEDPVYQALHFSPAAAESGDLWGRIQVVIGECRESLRLIAAAGDAASRAPEGPRGTFSRDPAGRLRTPSAVNLGVVAGLLPGLEWTEAVLTLASLGLDMPEAALG
jgi:hypothetical protein